MVICPCVCDYDHYHLEEEERPTTMVTTTGEKAQGEGCHYDTTTRMTSMITATQDRLQERSVKRTTTSSDYIIRLTDRLLRCGTKIITCFSHKPDLAIASEVSILSKNSLAITDFHAKKTQHIQLFENPLPGTPPFVIPKYSNDSGNQKSQIFAENTANCRSSKEAAGTRRLGRLF